ncbi:translational activator of cytochrome c oxidase 1 [Ambystoma mexicanum]|uniref:translational activator of cytochrome c oxidase 1 n=1 Tax=Ambystoma mexicanum TaxID=8296 RepID=UPI0037E74AD0
MAVAAALATLRSQCRRIISFPILRLGSPQGRCALKHLSCPVCCCPTGSTVSSHKASIHTTPASDAGHNKWSKVKHIKGPKDEARANLFAKLTMKIKFAVKEGGSNPDFNVSLAQLMEQCRAKNMPKSSVDAAIKGAEKGKNSLYVLYEGRGPGGASLLIEAITDNPNRARQEIKYMMNKNRGMLCDGVRHCFSHKGVIAVRCDDHKNQPVELDQALEMAIEAGAEEVIEVEDEDEKAVLKFICDIPLLREVRQKLDSLGLISLSTELEYIPNTKVSLSDADLEHAAHLLGLLNAYQDVIRVYDNIE